jgi:hypothetical protein
MRARFILAASLVLSAALAAAQQQAETVFTEGEVSRRDGAGKLRSLEIGDGLSVGDSVVTKAHSTAELKLRAGTSSIRIKQDTVFTLGEVSLGEVSLGGEKRTVLQTVVGSASMKFGKMTAKEPLLGTSTCICGVRGTEVELYGGMDGSAVVAVVSGAIELQSGGASVELGADEAVELRPGEAPGPKFAWIGKELDFSAWEEGKLEAFLADPVASALKVEEQLASFRASVEELLPRLAESKAAYELAYAELSRLVAAKDEAKAEALRQGAVFPLMEGQATLILNIRYYALSSLSLRRYVLGGMYAQLRTRHPLGPSDPSLAPFLEVYERVLKDFEASIVLQLVEADI